MGSATARRTATSMAAGTPAGPAFSEILAFYGVDYWYARQVTILGLGPIWQSDNVSARRRAAQWLDDGAVFAFGLSERAHGADIYSTDMVLTPDGGAVSEPRVASSTSVTAPWPAWSRCSAGGRTWMARTAMCSSAADSQHENYRLVKNIVQAQMFVAEFRLENYPVGLQDVLHTGKRPSLPR